MTLAIKTTDPKTGKQEVSSKLYKTELCANLYKDTGADPRLIDQFLPYISMADSLTFDWYCPVMSDIQVQNDPRVDLDGIASYFVINYCNEAASNLGYDDENCETNHTKIDVERQQWLVNTKMISQYFEPDTFTEKGYLNYTVAVQKTGFFSHDTSMIPQMDFRIHQTKNYVKDSKILDVPSSPSSIPTYRALYTQTNLIQTSDAEVSQNGVFQVFFSQDPEVTQMHFSSEYTFLGAIALVGGMISSYYYLIIFGMSGYTKFKYENELAKKLFTTVMKPDKNTINVQNVDD